MTPKQASFVQEYLVDLNATQAAIRAGYSPKSAEVEGCRLLKNAKVAQAIAKAQSVRAERLEISADRVAQEYARIAFAQMSDFVTFGPDGVTVRDLGDLTPDQVAAVAEVSQTTTQGGGSIKFKLHDKLAALNALTKHLGMNAPDKVALTNAKGDDLVEERDPIEMARLIAFTLAEAQAKMRDRVATPATVQ